MVELEKLYNNPSEFISLLATKLPERGAYFMRLLIVSASVGSLLELHRAVPLIQFAIRLSLGHQQTEKQRSEAIGPFKPLCVVDKFYFSRIQARILLYFMVLFVYSSISPIVNWLCVLFFLLHGSVYRHQFIFNYPKTPDSGGQMWLMFMAVILACMVISQMALWGFLGLRQAMVAVSMMIPLVIITGLFIIYLVQNFFQLGQYLPAHSGLSQDLDNTELGVDFSSFSNLYKNPALKAQPVDVEGYLDKKYDRPSPDPVTANDSVSI